MEGAGYILCIPGILFLVVLLLTILAIWKLKQTARIVLGIIGGLATLFFGLVLLIAIFAFNTLNTPTFDPATYKGQMGQIQTPVKSKIVIYAQRDSNAAGKSKTEKFHGENGIVKMPAGTYSMWRYQASPSADQKGFSGMFYRPANNLKITIRPNATEKLNIGPPFTASINVEEMPKAQMMLDLNITGCGNENCSFSTEPEARFQILSQSGQVLQEGKFEYG